MQNIEKGYCDGCCKEVPENSLHYYNDSFGVCIMALCDDCSAPSESVLPEVTEDYAILDQGYLVDSN